MEEDIETDPQPWWQKAVIYQIYPRSFQDSNGDGIGDLKGIIHRLDYLSDTLGVDAIWLSPFYVSPMADFGYDVADYTDIDPIFGSMQDFDELLKRAHSLGLKVIIDFVPNHTSNQHPWFLESRSSRENPKRDWYIWADPKPDGSPPNNWLSVFGGSAWEWDQTTGQFYLHSFLKEQPDLNWRNPQVKKAMFGVLRFWLDKGVDGFRIDVAHFILKDPLLRDNPLCPDRAPLIHKPLGDYDLQIHLYDQGHPDVHQIYREVRRLLDSCESDQPRVAIGEIHIFDWERWVEYYGKQLDELHMPFNFQLLGVEWKAQSVRQVVDALEHILPPGAWPNYVLGNHDEQRLASRIGLPASRLAAMLLLTLRGTPTLYYGDEIGMADVPIAPEEQQDPWGKRVPGLGRDPARTPMQWDDSPHAGFAPASTKRTWLPVSADFKENNVKQQMTDPRSLLNLYRRLLAYRKRSLPLLRGEYLPLDNIPPECYAYLRRLPHHPPVLIALNFSEDEAEINLTPPEHGHLLLSTHLDRDGKITTDRINLRPHEGLMILLENRFDGS